MQYHKRSTLILHWSHHVPSLYFTYYFVYQWLIRAEICTALKSCWIFKLHTTKYKKQYGGLVIIQWWGCTRRNWKPYHTFLVENLRKIARCRIKCNILHLVLKWSLSFLSDNVWAVCELVCACLCVHVYFLSPYVVIIPALGTFIKSAFNSDNVIKSGK